MRGLTDNLLMRVFRLWWVLLLCGCGVITSQGVYEGVRQQQQIRPDKPTPDTERLPDYDKFKQERDKLTPQAP